MRFGLGAHLNKRKMSQRKFYVRDLFNVEIENLEEHQAALSFIYQSRKVLWDSDKKSLESNITIQLCSQNFKQICKPNEVILEKAGYGIKLMSSPVPGIQAEYIGIGSVNIWHGSPDLRVRGTNIVVRRTKEEEEEEEAEDEEGSDGMSTTIVRKSSMRVKHLPQAISTCVTSSFTEHNLHPEMQSIVPTILIDGDTFRVILYDCLKDVLLISQPKDLHTKGRLSSTAVGFLWLVINHR